MRRRLQTIVLALAALSCPTSLANAETVTDAYRQALERYYRGDYPQAVEQLERLAGLPLRHEELFYNLGNAYFRWGKLGHAIYNYERALALAPDFDDARYNLELARSQARQQVKDVLKGSLSEPWWTHAVKTLSLRGWWIAVTVLWWLVLALVFVLRRAGHGPARAAIVAINGLLVALLLTTALFLAARIRLATGEPEGIILPAKVSAREGPDASASETFKLHAGLRVRVKSETAGWARVRLSNGLEGWVEQHAVGLL